MTKNQMDNLTEFLFNVEEQANNIDVVLNALGAVHRLFDKQLDYDERQMIIAGDFATAGAVFNLAFNELATASYKLDKATVEAREILQGVDHD